MAKTNRLIAAGSNRLQKAADATVDPAVPAELQHNAAQQGAGGLPALGGEQSAFVGGRVLSAEDIHGTPEEQLAYVTERLHEIDSIGRQAEDFVVLNKGVLLEVARERQLHEVAGYTNYALWAAGVLDVEEKYVFELLQDAARIRAISALGPDLTQHLTRASARKVVAEVIDAHGVEQARTIVAQGVADAAAQGKRRPTAAMLTAAVHELTAAPTVPPQAGSEISDPVPAPEPDPATEKLHELDRAIDILRKYVYQPLAPAAVRAAAEASPAATQERLDDLAAVIRRVTKRLEAAQRTVSAELEKQPVDAEVVEENV